MSEEKQVNEAAKELSKLGASKGGLARAEKLSPEDRSEIARLAVESRWEKAGKKILKALRIGVLKLSDDTQIPCAVLEDGTRVLRERSVAKAIGKKGSGAHWKRKKSAPDMIIPEYFSTNIERFIPNEVKQSLANPIIFKTKSGTIAKGVPATILSEICDIWVKAKEKGALSESQEKTAAKAEMLKNAISKVGIIALVDEATGYEEKRIQEEQESLQKLLALYLSEERLKWAKMFPDVYFKELFRLRGWTYNALTSKRPKLTGKITNQIVYEKLPPGVLAELRRLNPVINKKTGYRKAKFSQHLSFDLGQPDLRDHLLQLVTVMRLSKNWQNFKSNFAKAFPVPGEPQQEDLDFGDLE